MESRTPRRRFAGLLLTAVAAMFLLAGCGRQYPVLHPAGPVGLQELHLIELSTVLVLIVIVPVLGLLAFIVVRYRDKPGNKAPYKPDWGDSRALEIVWWGIPIVIIAVLGFFTVRTTYALTRPPAANAKPITIEVVSLDWKWLFEYPGQKVATVNYCEIPTGVPVQFVLTANSPMNSFWVPQLGGQEYAMPGMAMRLWLLASQSGDYYGHGANFTGRGFANTTFHVIAKPQTQFDAWIAGVKSTAPVLTTAGYQQLVHPSIVHNMTFSAYPPGTFYHTVMNDGGRYMAATMQMMQSLNPGGSVNTGARKSSATAKSSGAAKSSMAGMSSAAMKSSATTKSGKSGKTN